MRIHFFPLLIIASFTSCHVDPLVVENRICKTNFYKSSNFMVSEELVLNPYTQVPDTFWLENFSTNFKFLDHKPLHRQYLDREVIRMTILNSFDHHFSVEISNRDGMSEILEKESYRQYVRGSIDSVGNRTMELLGFDSLNHSVVKITEVRYLDSIRQVVNIEEFNPLIYNLTRSISNRKWNEAVNIINSNIFINLEPTIKDSGFDGNSIIIEIHDKNGYSLVLRHSPRNGVVKELVDVLIGLSGNRNLNYD